MERLQSAASGTRIQEMDLDLAPFPEYGELLDLDLSIEGMEQYLEIFKDPDAFIECCEGDLDNYGDAAMLTAMPKPVEPKQRQKGNRPDRRKRSRVPRAEQCAEESTPSRTKRHRGPGQSKSRETLGGTDIIKGNVASSEPNTAGVVTLSTPPPRIVHLHPSFHLIPVPESPGCPFVQTLSLSPHPIFKFPLSNTTTTPTYILVPAPPTTCRPPLSPVGGAVAPVLMGSSPPGSLSDSATRALSPTSTSPVSPMELSPCKDSPLPQAQCPPVPDTPECVRDYIQQARVHVRETWQEMEAGLSMTSHYVDKRLVQRKTPRSGRITNKDKELVIMGDAEKQQSYLGRSQIFEGPAGTKPKRCVLLLGNVGMGKTALIRKLCLDWSSGSLPQFDFVFLLDGKALTLTEPTYSLQTLLLHLSPSSPPCPDPETVFSQILTAPERSLIIFDGFKELRDYESLLQSLDKDFVTSLQKDIKKQTSTVRQLYSAILQRILLPGCTLLISARPRGTASQLLRRADGLLELCGFTSADVGNYLSQYFTEPALRASAMERLENCRYLLSLCWNPGLCRLVCLVLEHSEVTEVLPSTLTGLCHRVLRLKMELEQRNAHARTDTRTRTSPHTQDNGQAHSRHTHAQGKGRAHMRTRSRTLTAEKEEMIKEKEEEDGEVKGRGDEEDGEEERVMLSQLSFLAWEGVKGHSSLLPPGHAISARLRGVGLRTGLFHSHCLRGKVGVSSGGREGEGRLGEDKGREDAREEDEGGQKTERRRGGRGRRGDGKRNRDRTDSEDDDISGDHILSWANPFLQSFLAGVHLALSRTVSDRSFLLQTLPSQSGPSPPRGRRRHQGEVLDLAQRFAIGSLFLRKVELGHLVADADTVFSNTVVTKQASVTAHLEGLCHGNPGPAQLLEVYHYVHEASGTHGDGDRDRGDMRLTRDLARNLPEVLTFFGVPLSPPDVLVVRKVLEQGVTEGKSLKCLDLEDTGIRISGLRSLMELSNINTYRACIADVIALWEELEQGGEEELLKGAVSKFTVNPFKATQVLHIEHLAQLVHIHTHRRLTNCSSQSDSALAGGVQAVRELTKLAFELGPENGPLALPKLLESLPGLLSLQHLDLENSNLGDGGAEGLAEAVVSLPCLEILNLPQNCIGDQGVEKLAPALKTLPSLRRLSLYSNVICDDGAESLAAVLPHMASLTELDVKYNKLTGVGAQSLGSSLKHCPSMKSLRMWNQCIPYGVFERLQQQDHRILWD